MPSVHDELHSVYRTRALGTVAELVVTDRASLVAASDLLERELQRIDRVASRFRADSELTAMNDAAGRDVEVSEDLWEAVTIALGMADATDGLVDPTVGAAMNGLGYDRDFAEIEEGLEGALPRAASVPGWRAVQLNPERRTVRIPACATLDLGATAKALSADRAAAVIHDHLGCGVLVSLGGDAAVAGLVEAVGFVVGIADACTESSAEETVCISSGGLASSGVGVRRWRMGAEVLHHILDPRTGLPARPYWRTVSATAATCVQANAATTASVILGERAVDWLTALGLPARLVRVDGTVDYTPAWPAPQVSPRVGALVP
jgi:FAD:protein FMN transferase